MIIFHYSLRRTRKTQRFFQVLICFAEPAGHLCAWWGATCHGPEQEAGRVVESSQDNEAPMKKQDYKTSQSFFQIPVMTLQRVIGAVVKIIGYPKY